MSALWTGGSVGEGDKSWQQNSGSRWVLPDQAAGHRSFITDQAVLLICVSSHPCTLLRGRRGRPQNQMQISGHRESNSVKGQNLHCLWLVHRSLYGGCRCTHGKCRTCICWVLLNNVSFEHRHIFNELSFCIFSEKEKNSWTLLLYICENMEYIWRTSQGPDEALIQIHYQH